MSFGFSVGDFLAAAKLIQDIISSLNNASASSYIELVLELHGLQRALDEIEHLQYPPSQQAAVNSVKVAALMCQHPLDEFIAKLRKYERLGVHNESDLGRTEKLKLWKRKLQWGFSMEEEVVKLRGYIATHVGSLNMRLITLGLSTTSIVAQKCDSDNSALQSRVDETHMEIMETRRELSTYGSAVTTQNTLVQRLSEIISGGVVVQLKSLVELASRIWNSNLQIMAVVTKLQSCPPRIDTSHTWFQEPVRFEDALGRIIPIPSEYNWGKINAIIQDQFISGPGSDKVKAREYLLFNSLDSTQIISAESEGLIPGMSVTMSLIIGRYGEKSLRICPRIGCKSEKIEPHKAGGSRCIVCRSWFNHTCRKVPLPLRRETVDTTSDNIVISISTRRSNIRSLPMIKPTEGRSHALQTCRNERRQFKNLSIHFIELPKTPIVSNVRSQQHKSVSKRRMTEIEPSAVQKRRKMEPSQGTVSNGANDLIRTEASVALSPNMTAPMDPLVAWMMGPNSIKGLAATRKEYVHSKCPSVISEPLWAESPSATPHTGNRSALSECSAQSELPFMAARKSTRRRAQTLTKKWETARSSSACLRCKLLKKAYSNDHSCVNCQPSRARLWRVPCTRRNIKNFGKFMTDWNNNYEKYIAYGISDFSVDGVSQEKKLLRITHGYGFSFQVLAREAYMADESHFQVKWFESRLTGVMPIEFKVLTAKLAVGRHGISLEDLAVYLDKHITIFETFVSNHFKSRRFIPELLKTAYRYFTKDNAISVCKALKLVLAYNLITNLATVEQRGLESLSEGQIHDMRSKHYNEVMAPAIVNFQVKRSLASMWRELHNDILKELSALYFGVYSGRRLKDWFTIFILSAILLIVWEQMQFHYYYHEFDKIAVEKFCKDLETIQVSVIVGLFHAISPKLPSFTEWDTGRHGHFFNNNPAICEAMTEIRSHVIKHEAYLRSQQDKKFDPFDPSSLSNRLLSKLVIGAMEG